MKSSGELEVRELERTTIYCPVCDGEGAFMGALGQLAWFQCCHCGIQFNQEIMSDEETDDECEEV